MMYKLLREVARALPLVAASVVFVICFAVHADAGGVIGIEFTPASATTDQLIVGTVRGANANTCYSLAEYSFNWQGDTLFAVVNTEYAMGVFCLMIAVPWTMSSTPELRPPGRYWLHVTEYHRLKLDTSLYEIQTSVFQDSIDVVSCSACQAGNFDHIGNINISDLTALVGFMFKGQPGALCSAEGDINGDGINDISDLTHMVGYMFKDGAAPACP